MSLPIDNDVADLRTQRVFRRIRASAAAASVAALVLGLATGSDALTAMRTSTHRAPLTAVDQSAPDPFRHQLMEPAVFTPRARPARHIALVPSADGISSVALTAYERAASREQQVNGSCRIPWQLVAAIGYIESDDGQFGGDQLTSSGDESAPLLGVPLDGSPGVALMLDAHGHYARAEGPMQFLPSTWTSWHADGNGDRKDNPQNIFDATAAAADYLCSGTGDLSSLPNQPTAITHYNDSPIYVKNVMNVEHAYVLGRPASTVKLIPMPTPACPKGKVKRAHGPKVCITAKKARHIEARAALRPTRTPTPTTAPDPDPTAPPQNPATPSPSPLPTVTPTPTSSGPPTPTSSP